jgi:RNA polymerase subunit RPABC4/transcription elongation factor Spt4
MPVSACIECGSPVRDGARFCPACGSTVATVEPPAQISSTTAAVSVMSPPQISPPQISPPDELACAECGHSVRGGAQFCPACGSAVTRPLAAAVVPTTVPLITPGLEVDPEPAAPVVALTLPPSPTAPPTIAPPADSPSVAGPPVPPGEAPPASRGRRLVKDRRVLVGAVGALVLVLAGILALVLTGGGSKHPSVLAKSVAHTSSSVSPPAASVSTAQAPALTTATTPAGASAGTTATGINTTATGTGTTVTGTTATGTNTTAPSEPPRPAGPAQVIRTDLQDLGSGNYAGAFRLMSSSYRSANPSWASDRAAADPGINIVSIGAPQYGAVGANVPVDFFARDRNPTPGSDTQCREFQGTVHLVQQGGSWWYDPSSNNLNANVATGDSDCPS